MPRCPQVLTTLRLVDVSINHQSTGWLNKADVKTALAGFFKGAKKVDRLDEVRSTRSHETICYTYTHCVRTHTLSHMQMRAYTCTHSIAHQLGH